MTQETQYYTAVRNPYWCNAEYTVIECEVNFNHVQTEIWSPFAADPNDYMPYSKQIFDECVAGKWGPITDYVRPPVEEPRVATEPQPNAQGAQTL